MLFWATKNVKTTLINRILFDQSKYQRDFKNISCLAWHELFNST